jgi:hypothetical protein
VWSKKTGGYCRIGTSSEAPRWWPDYDAECLKVCLVPAFGCQIGSKRISRLPIPRQHKQTASTSSGQGNIDDRLATFGSRRGVVRLTLQKLFAEP